MHEYPALAANISAALAALKAVQPPTPLHMAGMSALKSLEAPFSCGGLELQVGPGGGLLSLRRGTRQWAGPANPLGQFLYETYVESDYKAFLHDLGSRIGDQGVWPHHTAGPYAGVHALTIDLVHNPFNARFGYHLRAFSMVRTQATRAHARTT